MGGFFGGLLGGQISDVYSNRTAMLILGPPGALLGGWLIRRGAHHIRRDISLSVEELLEEQEEARKIVAGDDEVPALQVRNLDFSYGPVQVLFDVSFDVAPGEVVALLGTNGAGKSTLLRAISGLGIPDRGVVTNGRTSPTPGKTGWGSQLRGGAGLPGLSIGDNLQASLLGIELEPDGIERRVGVAVESSSVARPANRCRIAFRRPAADGARDAYPGAEIADRRAEPGLPGDRRVARGDRTTQGRWAGW